MKDISKPSTLLGFDYGTKSIGVAVGQTVTKTARPLTRLKAQEGIPNWNEIKKLINDWRPDACIVGIPLNMDGSDQEITLLASKFADELKERFSISVFHVDERLTTIEAKAQLFGEKGYRALNKAQIDATSAKIILESWMADAR